MRKLTKKIKYEIIDGDLFLYGMVDGALKCVGTCHLSWLDFIKRDGFKKCFENGLVLKEVCA